MKSYIDYFEPGGELRYIKRYVTPEQEKEIPHNTTSSYVLWLMRKIWERNGFKKNDVKTPEVVPTPVSSNGNKYVVDLHTSLEYPSDTVTVGNRTFIINNKFSS